MAITLIILGEVVNGFGGFILGATLLDHMPTAWLHVGMAALIGLAVGIRMLDRTVVGNFNYRRWCLFGAFFGNFLLFGLLGGLTAPRTQPRDVATGAWGSRRIESRADTLVRPDTLRRGAGSTVNMAAAEGAPGKQTGKKVLFFFLFLLGIYMTVVMAGLACSIACAGHGFLALIVFMLGLGFPAGGIYFLGRAADRPFKNLRDMNPDERRRAGRRFWRSWGLLIGLFTLILLISAVASS